MAITLSEKPELREHAIADTDIWPEFNLQGETYRRLWPRLTDDILKAMATLAVRHGLTELIAPVRPTRKDRYPTTPIERYMTWRRDDGSLLDPWLRLHERLGARIGPAAPASYRIEGTVAEWEKWLGMALPESGEYVFPGGLSPLVVDVASDRCIYLEPNVWMVHSLSALTSDASAPQTSRLAAAHQTRKALSLITFRCMPPCGQSPSATPERLVRCCAPSR